MHSVHVVIAFLNARFPVSLQTYLARSNERNNATQDILAHRNDHVDWPRFAAAWLENVPTSILLQNEQSNRYLKEVFQYLYFYENNDTLSVVYQVKMERCSSPTALLIWPRPSFGSGFGNLGNSDTLPF